MRKLENKKGVFEMDNKLKIGDIRYFSYEFLDNKFAPGVVIGYKNRALNNKVKVECYLVILYNGHVTTFPIETTEIKTSRGLNPIIRESLTELCRLHTEMEKAEREYKMASAAYKRLSSEVLIASNKWDI